MSRIIGGSAGGRRLKTPKGDATRPTSDRVREAVFAALESRRGSLSGQRFLDLYAGSGAVGLEARSRGASAVTLVEHDRRTAAVIRDNVSTLGFDGCTVVTGRVHSVLTGSGLTGAPHPAFDVVFLDPPYPLSNDDVAADLAGLVEHGWLAPEATVVLERAARGGLPPWPKGVTEDGSRKYGETIIGYGRFEDSHAAGS